MKDSRLTARKIELCLESLKEIELLLPLPAGIPGRTDRICALATSIANQASHEGIADLARKIRSEATDPDSRRTSTYVGHLKAVLEAAKGTG